MTTLRGPDVARRPDFVHHCDLNTQTAISVGFYEAICDYIDCNKEALFPDR